MLTFPFVFIFDGWKVTRILLAKGEKKVCGLIYPHSQLLELVFINTFTIEIIEGHQDQAIFLFCI